MERVYYWIAPSAFEVQDEVALTREVRRAGWDLSSGYLGTFFINAPYGARPQVVQVITPAGYHIEKISTRKD